MLKPMGFEVLASNGAKGVRHKKQLIETVNVDELYEKAAEDRKRWKDFYVDNSGGDKIYFTEDMKLRYKPVGKEWQEADITEFAFGQLCTNIGIPAAYIKKCIDNEKTELAISNFKAWVSGGGRVLLVREVEGTVRAVLSERFQPFDNDRAIRTVKNMVDRDKYMLQAAHLSEDRLHMRYITRNPLDVKGDPSPMYSGFTISNSGVGRGSFNMVYYLYRQWCDNGALVTDKKGTLFRQSHAGADIADGKLSLMGRSLNEMENLNRYALEHIRKNQSKVLDEMEMKYALESARYKLKLSEKAQENIQDLLMGAYDRTLWGFHNAVMEVAQEYTLDTRIEYETYAGNGIFGL